VEYFAMLRSVQAIQRCDVAVLLLDAGTGVVAQDTKVAGEIHEAGRGAIVLWNKWDLVEKETMTYKRFEQEVRDQLPFLSYAPVVTISATERQRIGKVLELAWDIRAAREKKVETSKVNDVLERAIAKNPPQMYNRGTGKVYYATQTGTSPPRFTLFVNRVDVFPRHYIRYLNNQLRDAFGFAGTRIHLDLRPRS
jgi:GTP-binding protein